MLTQTTLVELTHSHLEKVDCKNNREFILMNTPGIRKTNCQE